MSHVGLPQHKIHTYIASIVSSSFFVLTNLILGWGKEISLRVGFVPVFLHNITDIFISRLWNNDVPMLIHHCMVISGICFFFSIQPASRSVLEFGKWIAIAEVSSFFNGVRFFYKHTSYQLYADAFFGIVFLITRSISSLGIIRFLYYTKLDYVYILYFFSVLYIWLNCLWSYQIIVRSRKIAPSISKVWSQLRGSVSKREQLKYE